jgi:hypothetical protein
VKEIVGKVWPILDNQDAGCPQIGFLIQMLLMICCMKAVDRHLLTKIHAYTPIYLWKLQAILDFHDIS